MKWLTSIKGAVVLSFIYLLMQLWRAFLDFVYVLPDYSGGSIPTMGAIALLYTLVFAAWLIGLNGARQGRRGAHLVALLFSALFWVGVDLGTILFYCPGGCEHVIFDITTWTALVLGVAVLFGLGSSLRRG